MNCYVITREILKGQEYLVLALFDEDKKLLELYPSMPKHASLLGNVYIGRVLNIVKNINAAFVKISPELTCYLPLEDVRNPIFTKKNSSAKKRIAAGDELLVQVKREAVKTKEPSVTTNLSLAGKYAVLTSGNKLLSVSSKISGDKRTGYIRLLEKRDESLPVKRDYGIIIRTNAADAAKEELLKELDLLERRYRKILDTSLHRTVYSTVLTAPKPYLKQLLDLRLNELGMVITDERFIFEEICSAYGIGTDMLMTKGAVSVPVDEITTKEGILLRYYRDEMLSLSALYGLKNEVRLALNEKVWLKSGAYLIIQPTEALTVIDVNTGKNIAGCDVQKHFLAVNKEAAAEIARQIRLRNLSGIIVVDFMNLDSKDNVDELLQYFRSLLKKDPVPTQLVDMTRLGLVEITRKKVKKSLEESLIL